MSLNISQLSNYFVIALFFAALIFIGRYFGKEKTTAGYIVGGRQMPWFAVSLSSFMALFSAISMMAIPGEAYSHGLRWLVTLPIQQALIPVAFLVFVRFYYSLGSFTPYEYLEKRFNSSARLAAGLFFLLSRLFYLAIVLFATAKAFEAAFGWNSTFSILLMVSLGVASTSFGGIKAVIWTDVLQFCVLIGGLLIVTGVLVARVEGGAIGIVTYAFSHERGFNMDASFFSLSPYERMSVWWLILSSIAVMTYNYSGDQITIQRLLSTKNYASAKRAVYVQIPVNVIAICLIWFMGIGLFSFYHQNNLAGTVTDGDQVFPRFFMEHLPAPIPGLLISGLIAASLTTINSGMNSLSSVFVNDIYGRFIHRRGDEKAGVRLLRIMTVVSASLMAVLALWITWLSKRGNSSVLEASGIWMNIGFTALGMYVLGVTSCRVGPKLVLVSVGIGLTVMIIAIVHYYMSLAEERVSFVLVGSLGWVITLVVGYAGAFFRPRLPADKISGLTLWTMKSKPAVDCVQEG